MARTNRWLSGEDATNIIWQHMNHFAYDDACFLAEQFHAEFKDESTAYTLATAYFRSGQTDKCCRFLSSLHWLSYRCRYLQAQCFYQLEKYALAINALCKHFMLHRTFRAREIEEKYGKEAPYVARLMGRCLVALGNNEIARSYFNTALRLNKYLFSCFMDMCDSGECPDIEDVYKEIGTCDVITPDANTSLSLKLPGVDAPQRTSTPVTVPIENDGSPALKKASLDIPQKTSTPVQLSSPLTVHVDKDGSSSTILSALSLEHLNLISPQSANKCSRLSLDNSSLISPLQSKSNLLSSPDWYKCSMDSGKDSISSRKEFSEIGISRDTKKVLKDLAKAYKCLSRYQCLEAIEILEKLPKKFSNTAWVLQQKGRAYYHISNFDNASKTYEELMQSYPYVKEGLEYYSSALWYLSDDTKLAVLIKHLDKSSAQQHCAIGNCFSVQGEHDSAIKALENGIQMFPCHPYLPTLLAHEYLAMEDIDTSRKWYLQAIKLDPRNYVAWAGLGNISTVTQDMIEAEFYFNKALSINKNNAALIAYVAMAQHVNGKSQLALQTLTNGFNAENDGKICQFHYAIVLITLEKYDEAIGILNELSRACPEDCYVYYALSKAYLKMEDVAEAQKNHFLAAGLDPTGIKRRQFDADIRYRLGNIADLTSFYSIPSNISIDKPILSSTGSVR